nr:transcription initiation factor TFIID subunit 4-like [Dermacentor andersoni]
MGPSAVILLAVACTAHAGNLASPAAFGYAAPASPFLGYGPAPYAVPAAPAYAQGPAPAAAATPPQPRPQPAPYSAPAAPVRAPAPAPAPRPAPAYAAPAPGYAARAPGYAAPGPQAITSSYSFKTVHGAPVAPAPVAPAPVAAAPAPVTAAPAPVATAPAPAAYAAPAAPVHRVFANPGVAAAPVAYAPPAAAKVLGAPAVASYGPYPAVGYAAAGHYGKYFGSGNSGVPGCPMQGGHFNATRCGPLGDTPRGDGEPDPIPLAVTPQQ